MKHPKHLLVFRFSALGDIAMTVPVIQNLLRQYPELQITFVSNAFVAPLFEGIERLQFHAADLKGRHKGVKGLFQLFRELSKQRNIDAIADLHNVLRTKILRLFFLSTRKTIAVIDKGRKEKKALTRKENKILKQLKPTFNRYADVFARLGLPVILNIDKADLPYTKDLKNIGQRLIGVAPFAQHEEKMYPHEKMKEVLRLLLQHTNIKILLFGGGKSEIALLQEWEKELPGIESVAGKMSFAEELKLIKRLDVMVSMDSANMHLASLYGVPVVSVWGATHPFAGFYGWGQSAENIVQTDLYCRPCSVFGNKPCFRGDMACMHAISPIAVYEKVIQIIE